MELKSMYERCVKRCLMWTTWNAASTAARKRNEGVTRAYIMYLPMQTQMESTTVQIADVNDIVCGLEPCMITYMGDGYLVYPIQVCVPMNNWVIPSNR